MRYHVYYQECEKGGRVFHSFLPFLDYLFSDLRKVGSYVGRYKKPNK